MEAQTGANVRFRLKADVGASWQATANLEMNFAYTYLDLDTPRIDLTDSAGHHMTGEYDASITLYGVSARLSF